MKRLSTEAYQALRDALAVVTWYKRSFQTFLRTALRDHPELLVGLDFDGSTKREVADDLVSRLIDREARHQDVAIGLMLEIAALTRFPDIERLEEPDRSLRLREAQEAAARMKAVTEQFAERIAEQERLEAERASRKAQAAALRRFEDDLADLKTRSTSAPRPTLGSAATTSRSSSPTSSRPSTWSPASGTQPTSNKLTAPSRSTPTITSLKRSGSQHP